MSGGRTRFRAFKSLGGAHFIEDGQDGSRVAIVFRGDRAPEKTAAMLRVMVDALNKAAASHKDKEQEHGKH